MHHPAAACRRRHRLGTVIAVVLVVLAATIWMASPAVAATATVSQDQADFVAGTAAYKIAWPGSTEAEVNAALPIRPWGYRSHSCAVGMLTTPGGEVKVFNNASSTAYICYIGPDWNPPDPPPGNPKNTDPQPRAATIVNNGEDDYRVEIVPAFPVSAIGFSLLTNSQAAETVTLTYSDGTTEVIPDSELGTSPNSFEFIGFSSPKPIKKVLLNTSGGAVQNEGIEGIWLEGAPTRATDCVAGEHFVTAVGSGSVTPIVTVPWVAGHEYEITARGTYYAGGTGTWDIRADAEYSQDAYQRANGLAWTDLVNKYGGYGEELLELEVGLGADPTPVEWGSYSPNHTYTITRTASGPAAEFRFKIYDIYAQNNTGGLCVSLKMLNRAPVADPNGPYLGPVNVGIPLDGTGSSDPDGDLLTYGWKVNGTTLTGATPTYTPTAAGIYSACLVVNDGWEDSAEVCTSVVVYDPSAGFVTGGGWIDSPAGAYAADPELAGKATFGFVSKYKKGASVPEGNTEFQFKAGALNFHSSSYDWLVVTGSNGTRYAKFKGSGTINGMGDYKFQIWAGDGAPDTFRIKIWTETGGVETVVYDNGTEQALGGGSIVVHAK